MAIKKDGRKLNRHTLEHLRKQSIRLWKKGKKVADIAIDFGVSNRAVYYWINTYKKKGLRGLNKRKAPGASRKLSFEEIAHLLRLLKKTADHYGFETPLWNCKKIQQLIRDKLNIVIDVSNVWRLLKKLKLSPQKPKRQAVEKDEKEVKRWIKEEWPKIMAHARRWQAMLYFLDESGVSLNPVLGKTWAPKGKTPTVKVTGKRGGICVTSAISQVGRMVFRLEKEKVNAGVHIEFLKQLQKNHKNRKIIVVEDNARPHIAKKVEAFVEKNKRRFAMYFLPSYSPDLNPDEHVWAYLKHHELKTHQAKSMKEFKPLVLSKMKSIQRKKKLVKSFFYGSLLK